MLEFASRTPTRCESSLVSLAASRRESPPETPNEDQHTPLSPQCSERQAAPSAISVLSASDPTVRSGSISAQCHSFSIPYHPCQSKLTACSDAPATSPLIPSMSELRTKQESAVRAEAAGSISFTTIAPLRLLTDSNSVIHIPSAQTTIPSEDSMSLKSASSENLFAILPDSSQNSNLFMKAASIQAHTSEATEISLIQAETSVKFYSEPEAAHSVTGTTVAPIPPFPLEFSTLHVSPNQFTVPEFRPIKSLVSDGDPVSRFETKCETKPTPQSAQPETISTEAPLSPFSIISSLGFQSSHDATELASKMVSSIESGSATEDSRMLCAAQFKSVCDQSLHPRAVPSVPFKEPATDSLSERSTSPCAHASSQSTNEAVNARFSSMPFDPGIHLFRN